MLQFVLIPGLASLIFQSFVATWQYTTQSSLFGYWFFGEPLLNASISVAKTTYFGAIKIMPYGTGVTMIFAGPPGTGKTATSEALAYELGKPLLVADYSQIQNCFVGQTEKNIVQIFQEAHLQNAVLLWDEADAMFTSRDFAYRGFEIRDTNVILQEVEKFDGVCILTSNRITSLDEALERRPC